MHAVAYQQFYVCFFARVHHLLSFFCIYGHRLFANRMLAGFSHTQHLAVVLGIGSNHIYGINILIVAYAVERIVV
jgi:hypothetical protein